MGVGGADKRGKELSAAAAGAGEACHVAEAVEGAEGGSIVAALGARQVRPRRGGGGVKDGKKGKAE